MFIIIIAILILVFWFIGYIICLLHTIDKCEKEVAKIEKSKMPKHSKMKKIEELRNCCYAKTTKIKNFSIIITSIYINLIFILKVWIK